MVRSRAAVLVALPQGRFVQEFREVSTNTRLRWTFDPEGELLVVHNPNLRDLESRWQKQSNQLLVEVQYALRR